MHHGFTVEGPWQTRSIVSGEVVLFSSPEAIAVACQLIPREAISFTLSRSQSQVNTLLLIMYLYNTWS